MAGWRHEVAGKKAKPFAATFSALGVEYKLKELHKGAFTIGNKAERLEPIGRLVAKVQEDGRLNLSLAASIHGLLSFASSFALGNSLHLAAHGFSQLASGNVLPSAALDGLCEHPLIILQSLTPREIKFPVEPVPVVAYTDGAFEGDNATWAAIVL